MSKSSKGFTLIELLVVIAIISLLSSILLVSLRGAIKKTEDIAAFVTGTQLLKYISACYLAGGNITNPTVEGNNICTLGGDSYGTWPEDPQGWILSSSYITSGENRRIRLDRIALPTNYIHCGHYSPWVSYCGGSHVGLCRLGQGWGCTTRFYYDGVHYYYD